jgi:S-DNA-T family DNA segregation ATPase FtsK/SpoIIIE
VLWRSAGGDRVVEITTGIPAAGCIADLVAALGVADPESGLVVDGVWLDPSTPLVAVLIREGSLVEPASHPRPAPPPSARVLTVTGGLRAGARHPVDSEAELSIGRSPVNDVVIDDPSVSRRHLALRLGPTPMVVDLGSLNGTAVDGVPAAGPTPLPEGSTVRLGASRLRWRMDPDDVPFAFRAGLGVVRGTSPFNRPPRAGPVFDPASVSAPSEPAAGPPVEPLSWAGIVLPLIAGGLVAWLLSPMFAIFAALGPILTVGTWLERRRRARCLEKQGSARLARGLAELEAALPAMRDSEISRLRTLHPDMGEVVRRATAPSIHCWERRPADADFMKLAVGTADHAWEPVLTIEGDGPPARAALDTAYGQPPLSDVPTAVDLGPGRVVGLVGPPETTGPLARALVLQAAVHHGPADLAIIVLADGDSEVAGWEWARWLPHCTDIATGRAGDLVAPVAAAGSEVFESVSLDATSRTRLVVSDGPRGLTGRTAPGRLLLADQRSAGLVIVDDLHHLPSTCATVVEVVHPAGRIRVLDPHTTDATEGVVGWGVDGTVAGEAARGLARLDDPELDVPGSELPESVNLVDLLGGIVDPEAVIRLWARSRGSADLRAPIGVGGDGPVWLDLVGDGPHVLIGGTTGSGKSELLRSLVTGLASFADPDHVAFVLIDYKGGAAFDVCAELPHVAGLVTDLDDRLAERALRCLEAELRHRESRLREVGAEDLVAYRELTTGLAVDPLPRLVVVIDEFASLAADLPEFLQALVGIAQRGRSLGVHLVLATQRPAGTVTEDMRANTGCRIALRVTDGRDSIDVIGAPDAATISRRRPGRAVARFGPGELVGFQSALVSGRTRHQVVKVSDPRDPTGPAGTGSETGVSDLERLVGAVRGAERVRGGHRPRSPWPPPLPSDVTLAELASLAGLDPVRAGGPRAWLVDDPEGQTRTVGGWDRDDGHLVVVGGPGSGTTTTLSTVALDAARRYRADDLHIHVIDLDGGYLAPLVGLPQVGSMIGPGESDRRIRLIRWLDDEIAVRRSGGGCDRPRIALVVDDLAGLARAHDPIREPEVHDRFSRIWADGPGVGVRILASVRRVGDLGAGRLATSGMVLVHRLSDPGEGLQFGCRVDTSDLPAGRAIRAGDGREIQIARPDLDLEGAVATIARTCSPPTRPPKVVGSLDPVVLDTDLPVGADTASGRIELVLARDEARLEPCGFTLDPGEHALVLGPPRSGRTNTLAIIGSLLGERALVVGSSGSELAQLLGVPPVTTLDLASALTAGPSVLLVDDADRLDDPADTLSSLVRLATGPSIVAATAAQRLRGRFGHWSADLRSCRSGIIFRPGPLDGDLLGLILPPRVELPPLPGRGLIVSEGGARVGQVALTSA